MKQLRVVLTVAVATSLLFTSFKPAKNRTNLQSNAKDAYYYWYLDNGTVYDDWTSVAGEITRLENEYDVYVDTNPVDGTLIASGYAIKGYPHGIYASYFLYSHPY